MIIDLTKLLTNITSSINIEKEVNLDNSMLTNTAIKDLHNVYLKAKISKDPDGNLLLEGSLKGTMILSDDITLEEVPYNFDTTIYEYLEETTKVINNSIDITNVIFENILVEVPSKVVKDQNRNIHMEGDGWRLITEEELSKVKEKNNPFSELSKLLEK